MGKQLVKTVSYQYLLAVFLDQTYAPFGRDMGLPKLPQMRLSAAAAGPLTDD
jgi:hypothetical protein